MTKKKSSNHPRNAPRSSREHSRPEWMRTPGIVTAVLFSLLVLLLVVMSVYRYYHLISHH